MSSVDTDAPAELRTPAKAKAARKYVVTDMSRRRGELLNAWMEKHNYEASAFARDAGVSKMTIGLYLRGELDIANMHQRTVEKLLRAMNVSDTWAWSYFEIPESRRKFWRTFRDPPLGHGEVQVQQLVTLELDKPMSGEGFSAPTGTRVSYDPGSRVSGYLLVRLSNRYVLALADALPTSGEVLGEFLTLSPAGPEGSG